MTRPGIEPMSPRPLANTLPTRPMSRYERKPTLTQKKNEMRLKRNSHGLWKIVWKWWFGFFVYWHINLHMLSNAKSILLEERLGYYLTHSRENKSTCPKVNILARLEFELAYYDFAVYHFNHYTTRTPRMKVIFSDESRISIWQSGLCWNFCLGTFI